MCLKYWGAWTTAAGSGVRMYLAARSARVSILASKNLVQQGIQTPHSYITASEDTPRTNPRPRVPFACSNAWAADPSNQPPRRTGELVSLFATGFPTIRDAQRWPTVIIKHHEHQRNDRQDAKQNKAFKAGLGLELKAVLCAPGD